jgi:hypothetical protein
MKLRYMNNAVLFCKLNDVKGLIGFLYDDKLIRQYYSSNLHVTSMPNCTHRHVSAEGFSVVAHALNLFAINCSYIVLICLYQPPDLN